MEAWYLLGALSVDHGGWRWGSEQGQLRAEKLAGLQRWGMVGHAASLIHTAEQVVLEHTGTQVSTNTACSTTLYSHTPRAGTTGTRVSTNTTTYSTTLYNHTTEQVLRYTG